MKFRIKHMPSIGYFAQVKTGWLSSWQKIGRHINGFGLYSENNTDHPLQTKIQAFIRCRDFKNSSNKKNESKATYLKINLREKTSFQE